MRIFERVVRARALLGLALAMLVALLVPAGAALASPSPSPTPTPSAQADPGAQADSGPHIGLSIGTINLNVTLPLSVDGVITIGSPTATPTSTPTTARPSSSPTPTHEPTTPATSPTPTHEPTTQTANGSLGQPPVPPTVPKHTSSHSKTRTIEPTKSHTDGPPGALILVQRLVPKSGTYWLVAVLVVLAAGVALVVRLGGWRGSGRGTHQA